MAPITKIIGGASDSLFQISPSDETLAAENRKKVDKHKDIVIVTPELLKDFFKESPWRVSIEKIGDQNYYVWRRFRKTGNDGWTETDPYKFVKLAPVIEGNPAKISKGMEQLIIPVIFYTDSMGFAIDPKDMFLKPNGKPCDANYEFKVKRYIMIPRDSETEVHGITLPIEGSETFFHSGTVPIDEAKDKSGKAKIPYPLFDSNKKGNVIYGIYISTSYELLEKNPVATATQTSNGGQQLQAFYDVTASTLPMLDSFIKSDLCGIVISPLESNGTKIALSDFCKNGQLDKKALLDHLRLKQFFTATALEDIILRNIPKNSFFDAATNSTLADFPRINFKNNKN